MRLFHALTGLPSRDAWGTCYQKPNVTSGDQARAFSGQGTTTFVPKIVSLAPAKDQWMIGTAFKTMATRPDVIHDFENEYVYRSAEEEERERDKRARAYRGGDDDADIEVLARPAEDAVASE